MTRGELIDEIRARLDERLVVEHPHPYGDGIVVTGDQDDRVVIMQPGGPHFVVTVTEGAVV